MYGNLINNIFHLYWLVFAFSFLVIIQPPPFGFEEHCLFMNRICVTDCWWITISIVLYCAHRLLFALCLLIDKNIPNQARGILPYVIRINLPHQHFNLALWICLPNFLPLFIFYLFPPYIFYGPNKWMYPTTQSK